MRVTRDDWNIFSCAVVVITLYTAASAIAGAPDADVKEPPPKIDSMVWSNPDVVKFIVATFGDSDQVDYASFRFAGSRDMAGTQYASKGRPDPRTDWWVYAPDSLHALLSLGSGDSPDNELRLWGYPDQSSMIFIEFCGTPCQFLDVRWIDNERFVFLQVEEHFINNGGSPTDGYKPTVEFFDLESKQVYRYAADPIDWDLQRSC